jgi:type VI secretion system protein ImpF
MAELTPRERLQPSLLDRLTDDEPDRKQESRDKRVLSPLRLRDSVRRDLSWLFNATQLATALELDAFPHVQRSTVNFGIPDLAGRSLSSVDPVVVERLLRRAIWDFEPRLLRSSVKVRLVERTEQERHNALYFTIEADLWAQPVPLRLFLKTELDLEDGSVRISELSSLDP